MHPYCGKTCANLAKSKGLAEGNAPVQTTPVKPKNLRSVSAKPTNTIAPGNTPDPSNTTVSPNTSNRRTPRNRSASAPANFRNSVVIPTYPNISPNNRSFIHQNTSPVQICRIPACTSPVYVDPSGTASKYCTNTHRRCVSRL